MTIPLLDRPAPIVDDATRRQFLIGGASLAALLAACGGTDRAPDARTADGRFPVTIAHKYGSTVGRIEQDAVRASARTSQAERRARLVD